MDLAQRLGKGVRRQEDYGTAGTQCGLDLGDGQPVVQREDDGVRDGRGEEEFENMMAVRQQDGDGRLPPRRLTGLGQDVMQRRRDTGNTCTAVGVRDPCPVHSVGRSRLVLPAGSHE